MFRKTLIFLAIFCYTTIVRASVSVEKVEYKGWENCYRISNGGVELIITGDVGPRIIRYGFVGGQNLFREFPEQLGKSGETTFQLRGGDRVWKAPEDPIVAGELSFRSRQLASLRQSRLSRRRAYRRKSRSALPLPERA